MIFANADMPSCSGVLRRGIKKQTGQGRFYSAVNLFQEGANGIKSCGPGG
jgi:hypothetical protein